MMLKIKDPIVKKILSALAVVVFGFILLNITFLADFLFQSAVRRLVGLFTPLDPNMKFFWFPPLMHVIFLILIGIISWLVFRSRLGVLYKAIYMTVPVAVVLATIGMFFSEWQLLVYSLGGLFVICVLYYLYRAKKSWLYYITMIVMSIVMLIVGLTGTEI